MKNWLFFLFVFSIGCHNRPYSKEYIYTKKDNHLPLQGKVSLLRKSVLVQDDALLSAISLLYAQNKDWIEAKNAISKAIKLNPLNPSYHLYLAYYSEALKSNVEAYEEAKVAFELGMYDKKLGGLLAKMAIETGDTLKSNQFVTSYFNANMQHVEAQLLMVRLYLMEEKYGKAENLVNAILAKDSLNYDAWKVGFATYLKINNTFLAINYGNKLLTVDSTNAQYYFQLANLYLDTNQTLKSAYYFAKSYQYKPILSTLYLTLGNYSKLAMFDSVLVYTDSTFSKENYRDKYVLLYRARAFDKRYKYDESYVAYDLITKTDTTDSIVNAEQAMVQRKIAYLQRKKREQEQLADSLSNVLPILNF